MSLLLNLVVQSLEHPVHHTVAFGAALSNASLAKSGQPLCDAWLRYMHVGSGRGGFSCLLCQMIHYVEPIIHKTMH